MLRLLMLCFVAIPCTILGQRVALHHKAQLDFTSDRRYDNPLYEVRDFSATFTSPTGREWTVDGFWDGGTDFRIRFRPDEIGQWTWTTRCSDTTNAGLHGHSGELDVVATESANPLYAHGPVRPRKGNYYLIHADGTPFFWTACTAWNGAMKSSEEEWAYYLGHRADQRYNVIQYVTTQWRGNARNAEGLRAFEGTGRIRVNPEFFRRIDERTDAINEYGIVAAPVLLWALQFGEGRELSPGYSLPLNEAVLLARYIVARLQGNHVVWTLGGDGKYIEEYEQRWKEIGRRVFGDRPTQSPVCIHPQGTSWTGDAYAGEEWIDIVGYQSSHSRRQRTVDWITQGPPARRWDQIPPRPLINMEPNYEEIRFEITAEDVRNASYWSVFNAPPAGITYGANGIWPWIQRPGELIENHRNPDGRGPSTWRASLDFPGSRQIGLLHDFMTGFEWWKLRPAQELLIEQPGAEDATYNHFVSLLSTADGSTVLAYVPRGDSVKLRLPPEDQLEYAWFDPQSGERIDRGDVTKHEFQPPGPGDYVLILRRKAH